MPIVRPLFQGRQQSHDHRVAEMQLRGHQEALEKERKLEAAQKRAAEAARSLATTDRQAQDDVLSSLRGAASKLLQTQSEAARVTADAALQLTQVGDWWGCSKWGCLFVCCRPAACSVGLTLGLVLLCQFLTVI